MKIQSQLTGIAFVACLTFVVSPAFAQSSSKSDNAAEFKGDPYTLSTCIVSGAKLGSMGEPVVQQQNGREYNGREVRFCCEGCVPQFKEDPTAYLEKADKKMAEQQKPHYPLDACVVSAQKLGSMGEPVEFVHKNRLFRLCCKGCVGMIESEPAKYFEKLDKAVVAEQKQDYPLEACAVSRQKLGSMGEPVDMVVANRLVSSCCGKANFTCLDLTKIIRNL